MDYLQPIQWLLAPMRPLIVWSKVGEPWLMATALNVIVVTTGIAKAMKWGGDRGGDWKLIASSAFLAIAYGCAQYLPNVVTAIAGSCFVILFSAVALKVAGLVGRGGTRAAEVVGIKPRGSADRGPSRGAGG